MRIRTRRVVAAALSASVAASVAAVGLVVAAPAGHAAGTPSATTLVLDRTSSAYGQVVTATATVTTGAVVPGGHVAFSVDGLATMAPVGADGVASLALPAAHAGTHAVTATFVPTDPPAYDGSASATQAWTVTRAATRARIPVAGRTTRGETRVGVRAKGAHGSIPTGKVRITITRVGHRGTWSRVRSLEKGSAQAGFGRLSRGRYSVTVAYGGDTDHSSLRKTKTFRVTRR
jgi:hypothetical protein